MGILDFIFGLIVVTLFGGFAIAAVATRAMVRGGRKLLEAVRAHRALPGEQQSPARPAQDVVIEDVADAAPRHRAARAKQADYVHLDVDRGARAEQIVAVMQQYEDDDLMGQRAAGVIETLESAERRRKSLLAELDGTFQRNTISWDRFATPAQAALDTILRNAAHLANRIQSFDKASYQRLERDMARQRQSTTQSAGPVQDVHNSTRAERLRLYREMLASLDAIQETNDGLLLELDKLAAELGTLSSAGTSDGSDLIIEEIRRLVDEAKYYRQS